jgi:hypothetical protein
MCRHLAWRIQVSRQKSLAITAAAILSGVALLSGCTSAPLTDPHEVLTNAEASLKDLQSVHFQLTAGGQFIFGIEAAPTPEPTEVPTESPSESPSASSGSSSSVSASLTPTPTPTPTPSPSPTPTPSPSPSDSSTPSPTATPVYTALPISLDGVTAEGDIDFANQRAHIIGGAPGIPGLSGELIVYEVYSYIRAYGATRYEMVGTSTLPIDPTGSAGPLFVVSQMVAVANDPGSNPVLVGMEAEPGGTCYHIRVTVTQSALNDKLASLEVVQALGSGKLDLWITQGDFQLERLEFSTSDPNAGTAAARLLLSNWNSVSPIRQPPEEQLVTPSLESVAY